MADMGTYTNYPHGDLGDANPGEDTDFPDKHLDPPELGEADCNEN